MYSSLICTNKDIILIESPISEDANGWSSNAVVESASSARESGDDTGQPDLIHCPHCLDMPSAFTCWAPGRYSNVTENWPNNIYQRASIPSLFQNFCSHRSELWSVRRVNWAPRRYDWKWVHMTTATSISRRVVQYRRWDSLRLRLAYEITTSRSPWSWLRTPPPPHCKKAGIRIQDKPGRIYQAFFQSVKGCRSPQEPATSPAAIPRNDTRGC